VRASGDRVTGEQFLLLTHDDNLRMQILLMLDNHGAHETGRLINVALNRHTGDHVAEFDLATLIGENWHVIGIPLHEGLTFFN
jgi:hypothetical protein